MNWSALVWLVVLLLANGFFVAAEFAYITARRNVLRTLPGRSAQIAAGLSENLSLSLAGAQLGITMASLVLGAVAEPAIAGMLELALGFLNLPEATLHAIALVIALLIVVFLHMVIGEMAPKNIAISSPEASAVAMALPFRAYIIVFRPLIAVLNGIANGVLRLFRVQPADALEMGHSADDLAIVISAGRSEGVIGDFAHNLLTGAIDFSEKDASDVMTPRPDVVSGRADAPAESILELMKRTGFSRILLHPGDLDDLVGFVHIKDLLTLSAADLAKPVESGLLRQALAVPESARIQSVLQRMRRDRIHLGVVIDEHGSVSGLLTMEDVAEELVGEITDEHDVDVEDIETLGDEGYLVAGGVRIDELAEIGVQLPDGDYTTIGGLLMEQLGRIPRRFDTVEVEGWELAVRATRGRRVSQVRIKTAETGAAEPVSDPS